MTNENTKLEDLLDVDGNFAESAITEEMLLDMTNNPFFKMFPPLIKDLLKESFPITAEIQKGYFLVHDFYKTKEIKLIINPDMLTVTAVDMEGVKKVETVEDIVRLNFYWLVASSTKSGAPQMTKHWAKQLLKRKLLKKVYFYVPDMDAYSEYVGEAEDKVKKENVESGKNKADEELEKLIADDALTDRTNSEKTEELERLIAADTLSDTQNQTKNEEEFNL